MKDRTELDRERDNAAETRTATTREPMTAESARTNPEVMERSQSRTSQLSDRPGTWMDMSPYLHRFEEIQAQFIEEPQEAVRKAEALVGEAVDRIMDTLREQLRRIQTEVGDDKDTERLRMAMKSYRHLIHSLGDHRAA